MLTINDSIRKPTARVKQSRRCAVAQLYARIAAHDDKAMFITLRAMEDVVAEVRRVRRGARLIFATAFPLR